MTRRVRPRASVNRSPPPLPSVHYAVRRAVPQRVVYRRSSGDPCRPASLELRAYRSVAQFSPSHRPDLPAIAAHGRLARGGLVRPASSYKLTVPFHLVPWLVSFGTCWQGTPKGPTTWRPAVEHTSYRPNRGHARARSPSVQAASGTLGVCLRGTSDRLTGRRET